MSARRTVDVSGLPTFAFGHHQLTWWATWSMIFMEGTMFVVFFVSYFFLRTPVPDWPPAVPPPELLWGTVNLVIILASFVPAHLTKKAAEELDLRGARLWLGVSILFALAACVVRAFEFTALNCKWDQNAYGSIVWVNLGFHTTHLVTDLIDSVVLFALLFKGPLDGKHFVDVSENSIYWYFVVVFWVLMYAVIYVAPRLM
ncbi:MAG TPA: cytochrome c oxidase subunit 3 [Pyrinomonadaceae bacterium]|nr:cytochrome c oxidase subunit 3 [Pyrinomonadaceae bacterium]